MQNRGYFFIYSNGTFLHIGIGFDINEDMRAKGVIGLLLFSALSVQGTTFTVQDALSSNEPPQTNFTLDSFIRQYLKQSPKGASRKDILFQFVVEAVLLGLCGAIVGMILGYLAVLHLAEDTSQMTFSWWVVVGSVLIALVTSFLFALYPAWQAAKLKPVEALKNE